MHLVGQVPVAKEGDSFEDVDNLSRGMGEGGAGRNNRNMAELDWYFEVEVVPEISGCEPEKRRAHRGRLDADQTQKFITRKNS